MSHPAAMLTDALVTNIRTSRYTDSHWARVLRLHPHTIRNARVGLTYSHVLTPPDAAPRDGNGRGQKPQAQPARVRRVYFDDQPTQGI
jgi:hypothetical protein